MSTSKTNFLRDTGTCSRLHLFPVEVFPLPGARKFECVHNHWHESKDPETRMVQPAMYKWCLATSIVLCVVLCIYNETSQDQFSDGERTGGANLWKNFKTHLKPKVTGTVPYQQYLNQCMSRQGGLDTTTQASMYSLDNQSRFE
ncbi:hypothetical protein PoB_002267400 [Plakobranchus ocellatus]|uniref:Uncharacterized protein n=1 Tax=Plakobranchus ocellatus TaxID=259542 RepID=A0AAV3ZP64_9GAST|nr:hypothetical protein PoB_002267400 [Plakobranchus ocellatus]